MALTLYDAVPSSNSDRTKIALHEKGLAYDRVTLDLAKKDQKRPEFLKLNPYGKVPVLNDSGKILFESCIINEYLDEQYPNSSPDAKRSPPPWTRKGFGRLRIELHSCAVLGAAWGNAQERIGARFRYRRGKTANASSPASVS